MRRDSFKYWAVLLFVIFAPAIIPGGCEDCGDAVACVDDDDCPPTEYCGEFVCTLRCDSQSVGDKTEGAGCRVGEDCNSGVCDDQGAAALCTCVGDGAGGSGGSAGSGGSGGVAGFGGSGGSGNDCGRGVPCDGEDPINSCEATCNDVCGGSANVSEHYCFTNEALEYRCYCMCNTGPCIGG
jgi:hypothetical protein